MPNKIWSDYDETGKKWLFNYIKTVPNYPGAMLDNYIYKYNILTFLSKILRSISLTSFAAEILVGLFS